jgi:chorismate mutase / prephenate dehydratase
MRVGYLGPEGTFTHETAEMAAEKLGWQDIEYVPIATSVGVVEALARGEVDVAVVVDATSLSGPMPEVNKAIEVASVKRLDHIQRVCHYHLLAHPGASLDKLTGIVAHAKATGDCRATLARIAPGLPFSTTTSTGAGVKRVADEGRLDQAAIGTATAGRLYGLVPLADNIEDDPENWTRWAILGRS